MISTFVAASSRSSQPGTARRSSAHLAASLLALLSAVTTVGAQSTPADTPFLIVSVPASPDSVVKLARFAMGAVKGELQPSRIQRSQTLVMTQYTRRLHSGAQTRVSLIAAVARKPTSTEPLSTTVELTAWAIDVQPDMNRLTMSGTGRSTTVGSTPTLRATTSAELQPYRLTRKDAADWAALEEVMYALLDLTAKP